MAFAASRLSLPHIADGPLAGSQGRGLGRHEDWSEIEDLLASPAPPNQMRRLRSRRHAVPLIVSTAATSAVFAGLLVAALGGLPGRCLQLDRCETPAAPTATASDSPPLVHEAVAARPLPLAPTSRVADADRPPPDAASSPVEQGRSVSENEATSEVAAPVEDAPAATPRHHGRSHRHWRAAQ